MKELLLASKSNQRINILSIFGETVLHHSPDIDETFNLKFDLITNSMSVSKKKAESLLPIAKDNNIIIASDTVVINDNKVLGKPKDKVEAKKYLESLSGKEHYVLSSFCIYDVDTGVKVADYTLSKVSFWKLSKNMIELYIKSKEWENKAGAYAIQGLASTFVKNIDGDYMGIVGLPISLISYYLNKFFDYELLNGEFNV